MARTSLHLDRVSQQAPAELAHKQLEVEKIGVIAGFLVGLPLAVGHVQELLASQGASDWLVGLGMVLTVAASTSIGLRIGAAIASRMGDKR